MIYKEQENLFQLINSVIYLIRSSYAIGISRIAMQKVYNSLYFIIIIGLLDNETYPVCMSSCTDFYVQCGLDAGKCGTEYIDVKNYGFHDMY